MLSISEENYLKAIFKISERVGIPVSTNAIARELSTSAASVTDMLKKLSTKALVSYKRYQGVTLTDEGKRTATQLIRRHRLWESFLVDKLGFSWDRVHDIAEQLEHIRSDELVDRLETHLGFPRFDPHGDPIPDRDGKFTIRQQSSLSNLHAGDVGTVIGVQNHQQDFLHLLTELNIGMGSKVAVQGVFEFEESMKVKVDQHDPVLISNAITKNVFVKKN